MPPPETRSREEYYDSQRRAAETGDVPATEASGDRADEARDRAAETGDVRAAETSAGDEHGAHAMDAGEVLSHGELSGGRHGDRDDRPPTADGGTRYYWTEVPRFLRLWQDLRAKLPERKAVMADNTNDPPGSWRGEGGQYLTPEQHEQAKREIAEIHDAEKGITTDLREVEAGNTSGGTLAGLQFSRKGEERLKEKIADKLAAEPSKAPGQAISEVNDAIRYTFLFDRGNYTRGHRDISQRLEGCGYELIYSKNSWEGPEYKGINTRWITPGGQRFEVQFHTQESLHAKQEITHEAYERIRNPQTTKAELRELKAYQREVFSWVPAPNDARDIPDFHRKGYS